MGLNLILCLFASILLLTSMVSSKDEKFFLAKAAVVNAKSPVSAPPLASPVKPPSQTLPRPPQAPAKSPTPVIPVITPPPHGAAKPPVTHPAPVSPPAPLPPKTKSDCIPLCTGRCKLHSRNKVCMRVCMVCCDRCKCVPPGTYGNKEKCGKCYTDWTTRGGKPKCP